MTVRLITSKTNRRIGNTRNYIKLLILTRTLLYSYISIYYGSYILRSKLRLFNTLVKPVLLYGSETWKINEGDNRKLDTFFFKCLRRILQIRWPYVVSNRDILAKTKLKTISTEVKLRRWKWVGHILRMEKNSNCETALTWTPEGRRKVGRPKTTWRSTIENERRILGWNSWNEARRVAADRTRWRRFTSALWATGPEEDR